MLCAGGKEESMRVVGWLLVLLVMSGVVRAAAPESESGLAMPQTLEQARLQRGQAESMRAEAERRYAAEQNLCYGKFLVNHCLAAARTRYTETMVEARRLAQSARDFEREARREELEAKETQRLADQRSDQSALSGHTARLRVLGQCNWQNSPAWSWPRLTSVLRQHSGSDNPPACRSSHDPGSVNGGRPSALQMSDSVRF